MFISIIVVHTVDVFGVEVKHVGQVVDSGYQVGGGCANKVLRRQGSLRLREACNYRPLILHQLPIL